MSKLKTNLDPWLLVFVAGSSAANRTAWLLNRSPLWVVSRQEESEVPVGAVETDSSTFLRSLAKQIVRGEARLGDVETSHVQVTLPHLVVVAVRLVDEVAAGT